ncbi:MAG: hypothetical protein JWN32_4350 [Solirubrobacterales bacterium]|nr:hypothetical protein [Solirubrobacterales bacterium]
MRFVDFLKATVLLSAASASALAVVTVAGAATRNDSHVVPISAGWWIVAGAVGLALGRRAETNPPIAHLLAGARMQQTLPEVSPSRILLNRLWPLLLSTVAAGALAFVYPQVSGVAAGFAIIWALAWRRQEQAVTAIEERDGVRFYVERTSPFKPIRLVRTPWFRTGTWETNGAAQVRTRTG